MTDDLTWYTERFWGALADGTFLVGHCPHCGEAHFPPAPVCPACDGDADTVAADGTGTLYSFTRQHRTGPGFEAPLVVGIVELSEGPRVLMRIDASYDDLTSFEGYVNVHQSNQNLQYVFAQGDIGASADDGGGGSSVDVTVTVNNVGTSAWEVTDVEGASGVDGGGENPTLTLEVGTRYRFDNNGGSAHPWTFQNADDDYLLHQDDSGSLEDDSGINYVEDSEGVTFTYTQKLADAVNNYRCGVHAAMEGGVDTSGGSSSGGGY